MTRLGSLTLALGLFFTLAAGAQAATLKVDGSCYVAKKTISFTGAGFAPNSPIGFSINGQVIRGDVTSFPDGTFKATYPAPTPGGGEQKFVFRATDTDGTSAQASLLSTLDRAVVANPNTTSNVRTWKAVFSLFGFGKGKVYIHYVKPNGKLKKTVELGKLLGACGRLKTAKRRVLPFKNPEIGYWKLVFDTRLHYSKTNKKSRVVKVRVFRA